MLDGTRGLYPTANPTSFIILVRRFEVGPFRGSWMRQMTSISSLFDDGSEGKTGTTYQRLPMQIPTWFPLNKTVFDLSDSCRPLRHGARARS
jgi:hypothetical protein